jgi:hypothetical protein
VLSISQCISSLLSIEELTRIGIYTKERKKSVSSSATLKKTRDFLREKKKSDKLKKER